MNKKGFIKPMDAHVGRQVRIARMAAGMSQGKLGDMLGITFQQIQKYEKGANRISASRLQQMVQALKLPGVEYFFKGGPGYQSNSGAKSEPTAYEMLEARNGFALARLWDQLTQTQRNTLLRVAHTFIDGRD